MWRSCHMSQFMGSREWTKIRSLAKESVISRVVINKGSSPTDLAIQTFACVLGCRTHACWNLRKRSRHIRSTSCRSCINWGVSSVGVFCLTITEDVDVCDTDGFWKDTVIFWDQDITAQWVWRVKEFKIKILKNDQKCQIFFSIH